MGASVSDISGKPDPLAGVIRLHLRALRVRRPRPQWQRQACVAGDDCVVPRIRSAVHGLRAELSATDPACAARSRADGPPRFCTDSSQLRWDDLRRLRGRADTTGNEAAGSLVAFGVLAAGVLGELELIADPDRWVIGAWISFVIVIAGCGNLFLGQWLRQNAVIKRAQEDLEEMAKVAERERIARDLHDLLGHTLSVIALKSELASKLADRDPVRAVEEIREVERVSRDALAEVRAAVEGYKGRGFSGELLDAEQALGSAGVRLDACVEPVALSPRQETVLALALRETVTNVVRHARASVCRVALGRDAGHLVMTVQDDGIGGPLREGHGLTGMRERVTAAGGTLDVQVAKGVRVCVRFPSTGALA